MPIEKFRNEIERAIYIKKLWSLIALIEYLDEQRYIKKIPITSHPNNIEIMSGKFENTTYITENKRSLNNVGDYILLNNPIFIYDKNDNPVLQSVLWNDIYEPVSKLFTSIIYPSENIKHLIENNFESEEDHRFRQQQCLTWIGITISFILGLFSIIYSLHNSSTDKEFQDKQFKTIESIKNNEIIFNNNKLIKLDSLIKVSKNRYLNTK